MARATLRTSALEIVSSFVQAQVIFIEVAGLIVGVTRCADGL